MSVSNAASAMPTWKPRHQKVPRENGSLLIEPSLKTALSAARRNRESLEAERIILQGRSLPVLRGWTRRLCFAAARQYTGSLAGESLVEPAVDAAPVFIAGHQPSLYHPGVWVKNFAIDRLAKASGGVSLNLIVDNDTLGATSLRVPTGTRERPSVIRIPFDAARPVQPWEDARVIDPAMFGTFADRVVEELAGWDLHPLLQDVWADAVAHRGTSSRLCDCLSAARHRQERRWGAANLELPISHLCRTEPFLWFASHLLAQLPRFRECHNAVLAQYRRLNRVRSRNHPVPRLVERDGWLEAPFWVWREGESQRRGVLARQLGRELLLSDGAETFARLPLSPEMDACCAVEVLKELPARGLRFRTRALTTTLFARLCLGDLFVHGIGGAKYDEMTDRIIHRFYGLDPPAFVTMSGTLHLPISDAYDVTSADEQRERRILRDLEFNADRHALGPDAEPLIRRKRSLIAEHESAQTRGLSRRERAAQRPANRRRHESLREVNQQLSALAEKQRRAVRNRAAQIETKLAANAVLQDREFSFTLFPPQMLRQFLEGVRV